MDISLEKVKAKSGIIYGLGENGRKAYCYLNRRYNIIGCSDTNIEQKNGKLAKLVPFIMPSDIKNYQVDYILVTSIYGEEILEYLTKDMGVDARKIMLRDAWCSIPFQTSLGEENPDKTFYIMSKEIRTKNGLLSLVFSVLEQLDRAEKNGWIPVVDLQSFPNQYLEEDKIGVENAWEYYYESLSSYSLEEAYRSKNVILGYDDPCYQENYQKKYNIQRMMELYRKYIHIKKDLRDRIGEERKKQLGDASPILGVLYRGTDMNALKLQHHPIQPELKELVIEARKKYDEWKCEKVFLSTEDAESIEYFKKEFGDEVVYTNQIRYTNTGKQWISDIENNRANDRYLRGEEYLTTISILATCDCLVTGISGGSVMAVIMNNNNYDHVEIIDKGLYI